MKKSPRFFCDNCGFEVGHEVKACPYCGRFFASVRCPSCSFTGGEKMFLNGCPMCGYSTASAPKTIDKTPKTKKKRRYSEPVPPWFYLVSAIALLVIIALLSWLITR